MNVNPMPSPTAVNYIPLAIPLIEDLTDKKLSEIIVSIQGEPVEIMGTGEVVPIMVIFHHLYKFSPECIYRTKNNRYLLFEHQAVPVIRDGDIIRYWVEKKTYQPQIIPYTSVDVEDLWHRTSGMESDRVKQLLTLLQEQQRAEKVTLTGNAPTLVFLLVQDFFEGACKSLFYQKAKQAEILQIY